MNKLSIRAKTAFPSRETLEKPVRSLIEKMGKKLVVRAVERQIFSERERYTQKKSVDDSLLSSPIIEKITNDIKKVCNKPGIDYIDGYIDLLQLNLEKLVNISIRFCEDYELLSQSHEDLRLFLKDYVKAADIDNAHAMYLSSDNWPFSVFERVLEELSKQYTDPLEFEQILSGGIIDIRTRIYRIAPTYVHSQNLEEHVKDVLDRERLVEHELWMPLLLFSYGEKKSRVRVNDTHIAPTSNRPTSPIVEAFDMLYHTRYLYDSFEYFGFYGFVRNAIAELCHQMAMINDSSILRKVCDYITLYQFYFADRIITERGFEK